MYPTVRQGVAVRWALPERKTDMTERNVELRPTGDYCMAKNEMKTGDYEPASRINRERYPPRIGPCFLFATSRRFGLSLSSRSKAGTELGRIVIMKRALQFEMRPSTAGF